LITWRWKTWRTIQLDEETQLLLNIIDEIEAKIYLLAKPHLQITGSAMIDTGAINQVDIVYQQIGASSRDFC
jgi:hypothetical protein